MPAALQLSERCCADSERALGPDHPDTLARMADLAHLYHEVGRIGDAGALLRRTAAYRERALPQQLRPSSMTCSYRRHRGAVVAVVLALAAGAATRYLCRAWSVTARGVVLTDVVYLLSLSSLAGKRDDQLLATSGCWFPCSKTTGRTRMRQHAPAWWRPRPVCALASSPKA
jgi:hypothetical protein